MKNLRPEGAKAEEGQEAPTREEAKRSTETEEGGDQERRRQGGLLQLQALRVPLQRSQRQGDAHEGIQ